MLHTTTPEVHGDRPSLKRAWQQSRRGLIAIGVFSVVLNILQLATPIFVLQAMDRVVSSGSSETLIMLMAITIFAIVCGFGLDAIRRRMFIHWGGWIERSFRSYLVSSRFTAAARGKKRRMADLLNDLSAVSKFVSSQGITEWIDIVWVPLFILVIYLIQPQLGAIVLFFSGVVLILGIFLHLSTRDSRRASRRAHAEGRIWVRDVERNRETIVPLSMSQHLIGKWSQVSDIQLDEGARTVRIRADYVAGFRFLRHLVRILIIGFGVWFVLQGTLTIGGVFACSVLARMTMSHVQRPMLRWGDLVRARKAYQRLEKALEDQKDAPFRTGDEGEYPDGLHFDRVAFRYESQDTSLFRNVTLDVTKGEFLAVLGASGVGKSSFCRVAVGHNPPRRGKVMLGETDLSDPERFVGLHAIGYLPQEIKLFEGTISENIARMSDGDPHAVVEAAKLAGVHEKILKFPDGYDTVIKERELTLSAGERQQIALARAFYNRPHLIVLDEPERHLDRPARMALVDTLSELKASGVILIVVSQSRAINRLAERAIYIHQGKHKFVTDQSEIDRLRRGGQNRSQQIGPQNSVAEEQVDDAE